MLKTMTKFSTHEHVSCLKYLQCRMLSHYFWLICTIRSQECQILSTNEAMIAVIISIFLFFSTPLIYFYNFSLSFAIWIVNWVEKYNLRRKANFASTSVLDWTKLAKYKNEAKNLCCQCWQILVPCQVWQKKTASNGQGGGEAMIATIISINNSIMTPVTLQYTTLLNITLHDITLH